MAFKMFVSESKPKVERTPRESRPHCHFTTTNGVNGGGVILVLSVGLTADLKLKAGNRVTLYYDSKSGRVGLHKDSRGEFRVSTHGGNASRVRISCAKFYKAHLAHFGDGVLNSRFIVKEHDFEGKPGVSFSAKPPTVAAEAPAKKTVAKTASKKKAAKKKATAVAVEAAPAPAPKKPAKPRVRRKVVKGEPTPIEPPVS